MLTLFYVTCLKFKGMNGKKRSNVSVGILVQIVQKQHQQTEELTEGVVAKILTKSPNHPHGIKVMLETGEVGRIKHIIDED